MGSRPLIFPLQWSPSTLPAGCGLTRLLPETWVHACTAFPWQPEPTTPAGTRRPQVRVHLRASACRAGPRSAPPASPPRSPGPRPRRALQERRQDSVSGPRKNERRSAGEGRGEPPSTGSWVSSFVSLRGPQFPHLQNRDTRCRPPVRYGGGGAEPRAAAGAWSGPGRPPALAAPPGRLARGSQAPRPHAAEDLARGSGSPGGDEHRRGLHDGNGSGRGARGHGTLGAGVAESPPPLPAGPGALSRPPLAAARLRPGADAGFPGLSGNPRPHHAPWAVWRQTQCPEPTWWLGGGQGQGGPLLRTPKS